MKNFAVVICLHTVFAYFETKIYSKLSLFLCNNYRKTGNMRTRMDGVNWCFACVVSSTINDKFDGR